MKFILLNIALLLIATTCYVADASPVEKQQEYRDLALKLTSARATCLEIINSTPPSAESDPQVCMLAAFGGTIESCYSLAQYCLRATTIDQYKLALFQLMDFLITDICLDATLKKALLELSQRKLTPELERILYLLSLRYDFALANYSERITFGGISVKGREHEVRNALLDGIDALRNPRLRRPPIGVGVMLSGHVSRALAAGPGKQSQSETKRRVVLPDNQK